MYALSSAENQSRMAQVAVTAFASLSQAYKQEDVSEVSSGVGMLEIAGQLLEWTDYRRVVRYVVFLLVSMKCSYLYFWLSFDDGQEGPVNQFHSAMTITILEKMREDEGIKFIQLMFITTFLMELYRFLD
jgi:hypothetical protein